MMKARKKRVHESRQLEWKRKEHDAKEKKAGKKKASSAKVKKAALGWVSAAGKVTLWGICLLWSLGKYIVVIIAQLIVVLFEGESKSLELSKEYIRIYTQHGL